jgi:hypothetical protein
MSRCAGRDCSFLPGCERLASQASDDRYGRRGRAQVETAASRRMEHSVGTLAGGRLRARLDGRNATLAPLRRRRPNRGTACDVSDLTPAPPVDPIGSRALVASDVILRLRPSRWLRELLARAWRAHRDGRLGDAPVTRRVAAGPLPLASSLAFGVHAVPYCADTASVAQRRRSSVASDG